MTPRITLVKSYRNKETLRLLELREVAELISQGEYDTEVSTFRRDLPTMQYVIINSKQSHLTPGIPWTLEDY